MTHEQDVAMLSRELAFEVLDDRLRALACPIVTLVDVFAFASGIVYRMPGIVYLGEVRAKGGWRGWTRV